MALQRYFWATCLASSLEAAIFTFGRDRRFGQCLDVVIGLKQRAPVVLTVHFLAEVLACSWHKGTATFVSVANLWIFKFDPTAFWRLSGFIFIPILREDLTLRKTQPKDRPAR